VAGAAATALATKGPARAEKSLIAITRCGMIRSMPGAYFSLLHALRLTIRRAHLPTTAVFKCLTIFLCIGESRLAAQAGFTGQTVSVDYEWPQTGTVLYAAPSATVAAGGTTFSLPGQDANAFISGSAIVISYPGGWLLNTTSPRTFDGWAITDLEANITGVSLAATNISGFTEPQLSFDNHHVYVNLLGYASLAAGAFITVSVQFGQTAATGACIAAPSGLVSWWPGDANENDIVGTNNPSVVNAVSLVPGEVLDGFTFGTLASIQIPAAPSLANQHFTWSAWVQPDGPGPTNDAEGTGILAQTFQGPPIVAPVQLLWRYMDYRFRFNFGDPTTENIDSEDTFPPGAFYFITATYDGAVFRLYVNGNLEGSFSEVKTVPYSSNTPWDIGQGGLWADALQNDPRTWNGIIDEVQAFNRALSQPEIQSIFNAGRAGECKPASILSGGAVSASAFGGFSSVSPGSWIEIYGSSLASDTRSWATADFNGINAPTSLDGTTVTIGGKAAFIDYISPGQVNALVASNTPTGPQQLTVTTAAGTSAAMNVTVNPTEP
jgi:hypothetical protein